jgi:DNA-binding response OmpR family regulator
MPGALVQRAALVKPEFSALRHHQPDLLVLDIHLPDGSGLDVLRVFPRETRKFPILVLTGDRTAEALQHAIELGADDFVTKPLDRELFQAKVESLLSRSYASPFGYYGDLRGICPLAMGLAMRVHKVSEEAIQFFSPLFLAPGSQVRFTVGTAEVPLTVATCLSLPGQDPVRSAYLVTGTVGSLPFRAAAALRRQIHALKTGGI